MNEKYSSNTRSPRARIAFPRPSPSSEDYGNVLRLSGTHANAAPACTDLVHWVTLREHSDARTRPRVLGGIVGSMAEAAGEITHALEGNNVGRRERRFWNDRDAQMVLVPVGSERSRFPLGDRAAHRPIVSRRRLDIRTVLSYYSGFNVDMWAASRRCTCARRRGRAWRSVSGMHRL